MNSVDLIIIIITGVGFVFGLFKGLIKELASLAAIFLGIYGAKLLSPLLTSVLINSFSFSTKVAHPVAYIIVFLVIVIVLLLLSKSLDKLFEAVSLGGVNKFFGGVFGALKYALILSVIVNIFDPLVVKFNLIEQETRIQSITYQPIKNLAPELWVEAKKIKTDNNNEQPEAEVLE